MNTVSPHLEALNIVNLREHIKRQVCDAILTGMFKPGERLIEATIADQLGVSRAPVREALVSLEREGIVASQPRRGYFVINFTDKDIEEIYSLRLLLEMEALRRAIGHFSPADITEMQRLVDEIGEEAHRGPSADRMIQLDLNFHEMICRVAGHSRLYSTWDSMRLQTWLLIGLTCRTHYSEPDQPRDRHQRILDAIVAQDLPLAEENLHQHILDAEQRARAAWRELGANGFEPLPGRA